MTKPKPGTAPPLKSSTPAANQSENSSVLRDATGIIASGGLPQTQNLFTPTNEARQAQQDYTCVPISGVKKVAVHFQALSEGPGSKLASNKDAAASANDAEKHAAKLPAAIESDFIDSTKQASTKSSKKKKTKSTVVPNKIPYPISYYETTQQESALLNIADNFRVQYMALYPDRKPLLLTPENDVGVKKLVLTTLQPTLLPIAEMYYWDGAARFVSSFIAMDVLEPPYELPETIRSPQTIIDTHSGNAFEMSILLASLLIGAGYDAYVACGYASKAMCRGDESLQRCPLLIKKTPPREQIMTTGDDATAEGGDQRQKLTEQAQSASKTDVLKNDTVVRKSGDEALLENSNVQHVANDVTNPLQSPNSNNADTSPTEQQTKDQPVSPATNGEQNDTSAGDQKPLDSNAATPTITDSNKPQEEQPATSPTQDQQAPPPPPPAPTAPVIELDPSGPEIEWTSPPYVLRPKRNLTSDFTVNIIQRNLLFKYEENKNAARSEQTHDDDDDQHRAAGSRQNSTRTSPTFDGATNGYEAGLPNTILPTVPDETDPLIGMRVHSWVLVRAGRRAVPLDFFIEPCTGRAHHTTYRNYHGVESVWNHRNYYVNMQLCAEGLRDISFNLNDSNLWEKLLVDENGHGIVTGDAANETDRDENAHTATDGDDVGNNMAAGQTFRGADGGAADADNILDTNMTPGNNMSARPNIWDGPEQNIDAATWRANMDERARHEAELKQQMSLRFIPMPKSWLPKLRIPFESFDMVSKHGVKRRQFLGSTLEVFGKHSRDDGMTTRLVVFHDRDKLLLSYVKEIYTDREDGLEMRLQNYTKKFIKEFYAPGRRTFALKEHYFVYRDTVEGEQLANDDQNMVRSWMNQPLIKHAKRVLTFYHHYRDDGLFRVIEMERETLFVFEARADFLRTRRTVYSKPVKQLGPRGNMADRSFFQRPIVRIVERFLRDPSVFADDNVAQREFLPQQNMCMLTSHRIDNYITASTRTFCFPTEEDTPSEHSSFVRMDREVTESYAADPRREPPSRMQLFRQMSSQQQQMEKALIEIRSHEDELNRLLRDRIDSEFKPKIDISLYDIKRHTRCQKVVEDMGRIQATEMAQKEKPEKELDFLAPFLARYGCGTTRWPARDEAMKIRAECIKDFQDKMVARANRLQEVYEDYANKMQEKENWYRELQIMGRTTRAVDREFEEFRARASTMLQAVEGWHIRLQDRAPMRLHELHAKLQEDERLSVINNPARYRDYIIQQQVLNGGSVYNAIDTGGAGDSPSGLPKLDVTRNMSVALSTKVGSAKSGDSGAMSVVKHAKFASSALKKIGTPKSVAGAAKPGSKRL